MIVKSCEVTTSTTTTAAASVTLFTTNTESTTIPKRITKITTTRKTGIRTASVIISFIVTSSLYLQGNYRFWNLLHTSEWSSP